MLLITKSNAQGRFVFQHEIGADIGLSNFQGDFKTDAPMDGQLILNGFEVSGTHYLYIIPRYFYGSSSIYRHLLLKTNVNINFSSFNNNYYGTGNEPLNDPYPYATTPNYVLLARLKSQATTLSLNNELQFYLKDVLSFLNKYNRYTRGNKLNPYLGLGFGMHLTNAAITYDDEALENDAGWNYDIDNSDRIGDPGYPDDYGESSLKENNFAFSLNFTLGTRYKLGPKYDFVAQLAFKHYFSDFLDGVKPESSSNNNDNDFNSTLNLGIIYHLF